MLERTQKFNTCLAFDYFVTKNENVEYAVHFVKFLSGFSQALHWIEGESYECLI